jgi:ATP-dependent protease HslVU (ClpYQ) peptidase subunit
MTCIAGLVDRQGNGYIASDSVGSNGYTKGSYRNKKIFKKDSLLIGYTSSYRMGQLLEYQLQLPKRAMGQSLDEYMYVDFMNTVRGLFKSSGFLRSDSGKESIGTFMIITEGRIFKVQDDMAILESSNNFDTCGSGEDYARAALHILSTRGGMTAKEMLTKAIETAAHYVTTVGGDIQYMELADKS